MHRLLVILVLLFQPLAAFSACDGTDLIDAMPESQRQQVEQAAARQPFPEGLLWRAEKGDTVITLFGTYHFRHDQTDDHLDKLRPLIETSDAVYLEMSTDDQLQFQRDLAQDPSLMFITTGPTLPDLLDEADWTRLAEEMNARSIPSIMAAKFKPLWAAMMLGIGPCEAQNGALNGKGIDALIGAYADETVGGNHSLEDFGDILTLLDSDPLEKQLDMIRLSLAMTEGSDDMAYTIRERYLAQEIALTWEFARAVSLQFGGATAEEDFARLEDVLLITRNTAWVDLLMKEASGKNVFLAAGAGHLPGKHGVLYLLQNQGFTITRLPF